MWLRTAMNYQYKFGGTLTEVLIVDIIISHQYHKGIIVINIIIIMIIVIIIVIITIVVVVVIIIIIRS